MMALIRAFDYIYYRVYHIYKFKWKDNNPGAYATSLVTLLQSLLVVVIPVLIYSAINGVEIGLGKIYYIGVFLVFFVFNYFRYNKVTNYENLAKKWNEEEKFKRRNKGILIVVFIVITLLMFFALITYLGKIHRNQL